MTYNRNMFMVNAQLCEAMRIRILTCDEGCLVGYEIGDGVRDVFCGGHTSQRGHAPVLVWKKKENESIHMYVRTWEWIKRGHLHLRYKPRGLDIPDL